MNIETLAKIYEPFYTGIINNTIDPDKVLEKLEDANQEVKNNPADARYPIQLLLAEMGVQNFNSVPLYNEKALDEDLYSAIKGAAQIVVNTDIRPEELTPGMIAVSQGQNTSEKRYYSVG